jgi:hypothetical protein
MDDLPDIRAKIKAHFSNNYQRHLFTLSMGEGKPATIKMKSLCNFLASSLSGTHGERTGMKHAIAMARTRIAALATATPPAAPEKP